MSCDRNGRKCATAAVRNGIAGHAGRSLNAISSWQTLDTLVSGKVHADKLPEQAANMALGTLGLKLENGQVRLKNVMGLVIGTHALEHVTGSAVTLLTRTALRGQAFATYRGILLRRSPLAEKFRQKTKSLSGGRITPKDTFYFHESGRTWSVSTADYRFPGNLPLKTLSVLRSHSFPNRAFYFDRALAPQDAVDVVMGDKDPETQPGFLGATNEIDALAPAIKSAKLSLMTANWLTMDDSERDTRTLDIIDYGTLARPARYSSPFNPSTRAPTWRSPGYANIVKTYGSQTRTAGIPVTEGYGGLKAVPEKAVDTSAFVGDLFGNRTPPKKSSKITATSNYEQLTREVGKALAPPTISVSGKGERPLRVEALDQFADGRILAEAYYGEADGSWTPITDESSQAKIATFITDKFKKLSAIAD